MYYNSAGTLCQYIYRKWADIFAFLCSLPEGTKKRRTVCVSFAAEKNYLFFFSTTAPAMETAAAAAMITPASKVAGAVGLVAGALVVAAVV